MKPILIVPDKVLFTKTEPVGQIDKNIQKILNEMKVALLAATDPKGVGLAAPQIGYPLQIFCIKPTGTSLVLFFLNPKIIKTRDQQKPRTKDAPLEGCLSIPNTWGIVKRADKIVLEYTNAHNNRKTEEFKGFTATIIQHEMDHLNGVLFTQRVLEQGQKLYEIIKDKRGKESLKELPL